MAMCPRFSIPPSDDVCEGRETRPAHSSFKIQLSDDVFEGREARPTHSSFKIQLSDDIFEGREARPAHGSCKIQSSDDVIEGGHAQPARAERAHDSCAIHSSDYVFEGKDAPVAHDLFKFQLSDDVFDGRDAPPAHFSFKIQSFSSLSKASIEKYTTDKFQAGDYKWKLSIYPTGNKERGGEGHISIGLALVDTCSLPVGWEVKAIFSLFVFDQLNDKYICLTDGKARRFHAMKTKWEVPKFINLEVFRDVASGYLINDTCVFGAEIFVIKQIQKQECLSLVEEPLSGLYTWTVKSYSCSIAEPMESNAFNIGDYKWRIRVYPQGNGDGKGNSFSAFLRLDESSLPPDTKLFVKFSLRVKDQNQIRAEDFEFKGENHFGPSCLVWGAQKFLSLAKLTDPRKGFLVNDTFVIEARVTVLGTVSPAS